MSNLAPPIANYSVYYCEPGSNVLFRVCVFNTPKVWKRAQNAERFARESLAAGSPLANSLNADTVYVGTPETPRMIQIR